MPSYAMRVARRGKKTTSMFSPGTHMSSLRYATGDLPEKCQIGINSVDPLYWNTHASAWTFEANRQKISLNCSKGSSMETR